MASEGGSRRFFKVWSGDRRHRKAVMASSLANFLEVACAKLGYSHQAHRSELRVALECDGTDVEDETAFAFLPAGSVLLLLLPGEQWLPPSVEAIKTAINAIPQIVCDAMQSLEIVNTAPSWKIMEHRGKVTVVLTWEPQDRRSRTPEVKIEVLPDGAPLLPGRGLASGGGSGRTTAARHPKSSQSGPLLAVDGEREPLVSLSGPGPPSLLVEHRAERRDKRKQLSQRHIDVDGAVAQFSAGKQHSDRLHHHQQQQHSGSHSECDFHCASLHQQQQQQQQPQHQQHQKGAGHGAGSPLVDQLPEMAFGPPGVFGHGGGGLVLPQSKSVHFEHAAATLAGVTNSTSIHNPAASCVSGGGCSGGALPHHATQSSLTAGSASSAALVATRCRSSETSSRRLLVDIPGCAKVENGQQDIANTALVGDADDDDEDEDEQLADRYLLLVDQLSVDQDRHLTIKDIGVILERLSSKVVDVERLEREKESNDIHNWTIKATLRGGHVLSEVGVVYNGRYYGVMEHPGYF